jgi:asparagine synthase (glutamine-hydrolysing)
MCGIFALIKKSKKTNESGSGSGSGSGLESESDKIAKIGKSLARLSARGPEQTSLEEYTVDYTVNHNDEYTIALSLGFTRLAINGLTPAGMQPFHYQYIHPIHGKSTLHWICNGEIYNHVALAQKYGIELKEGTSDCYVLGPMWLKLQGQVAQDPSVFFNEIDGVFSLILWDSGTGVLTIGRDPFGVRPLFYAQCNSTMCFASELKAIEPFADTDFNGNAMAKQFPPGSYQQYITGKFMPIQPPHKYWHILSPYTVPNSPVDWEVKNVESTIRKVGDKLVESVRKRLMTERPIASLLSGGLDSSLIASIVQHELDLRTRNETSNKTSTNPLRKLATYSIGFEGSPDLYYAKKVAEFIGSDHREIVATPDEFYEVIPDVIRDIESYDTTTVRASVGNWLICKKITEENRGGGQINRGCGHGVAS